MSSSERQDMKKTVFLFSGEGTMHERSGYGLAKSSALWPEIDQILREEFEMDLEELWNTEIGRHKCPASPLLTIACQICLADIWKRWGFVPNVVTGHSIGEISAAFEAGLYSLQNTLRLTYSIGQAAAKLEGAMIHGLLTQDQIDACQVTRSSENFHDGDRKHVTLSGTEEEIAAFLKDHPDFTRMRPPHPWHHPDYARIADAVASLPPARPNDGHGTDHPSFVTGVPAGIESGLGDAHWKRWLSSPIDFIGSMEAIRDRVAGSDVEVIEIGFHPVLEQCCTVFESCRYASSMYRGEDEVAWILHQRRKLDQDRFRSVLDGAIHSFRPGMDYDEALAYQDFSSRTFVEFAAELEPLFPGLAPQDFYRYKSVRQLIDGFGSDRQTESVSSRTTDKRAVAIAGMSCRFPTDAENPAQFWRSLTGGEDQVGRNEPRGSFDAGFLSAKVSKFDHRYFGISEAEARTMDPQQILALELTEMLFRDAGIDPQDLDRRRVGVYLGVWNEEYRGDRSSVYYPTGTNPSIIASRISYHYDLRGPSWVSNTACSSSLVALHYAAKDIEAGRVDYAIAGGVNMILGNTFTGNMSGSGFLSKDGRCKAFDNSADGYVRSEGGGLVLLAARQLVDTCYAVVAGSSTNQSGGRAQVITAPHPEAQEEVILDACREAGIDPREIGYVECHGTGTKIGDPIEVSALQNTVARERVDTCYLGSVKSNIGHLESAAGIAGVIKALLVLNYGKIPADLHFTQPNEFIDFEGYHLKVVDEETEYNPQSYAGVSSFGFGGANGHVVLSGVSPEMRKSVREVASPFDRERAAPLSDYYSLSGDDTGTGGDGAGSGADDGIRSMVEQAYFEVTNIKDIDPDVELTDQGLDSLGATQFVTTLQQQLGVELDPDLLFDYPLLGQLVEHLEALGGGSAAPRTREAVEEVVSRVFCELTSVRSIDGEVELTDQGLDSLSATQFVSQLEKELAVSLDPDVLFDSALLRPLCDHLMEELGAAAR